MARALRWALALSGIAALGYTFHAYSISPDIVPLHYDGYGMPDRWGPRGQLLIIHAGIIGLGSALFLALPELLRRAPASMINIPNKDYWLAPERRDLATAKFAAWAATFGITLNLMMVTMQVTLAQWQSARPQAPSSTPALVIIAFSLFTLGSCVWLVWAYRLPKEQ